MKYGLRHTCGPSDRVFAVLPVLGIEWSGEWHVLEITFGWLMWGWEIVVDKERNV